MRTRAPHEHAADPGLVGLIFAAAAAGCGVRRCAWCGGWLGLALELPEGVVTHGISARCEAQFSPAPQVEELKPEVCCA